MSSLPKSESNVSPARKQHTNKQNALYCAAARCNSSNNEGVLMHLFPRGDPSLCRRWVDFVSKTRRDFVLTENSYLCERHFVPECYASEYCPRELSGTKAEKKELLPGSVPTLHYHSKYMKRVKPYTLDSTRPHFDSKDRLPQTLAHNQTSINANPTLSQAIIISCCGFFVCVCVYYFLQLYCPNGISPMGISDSPTVTLPNLQCTLGALVFP